MTGLRVSTLGLRLSRDTATATVERAIQRGCSLFDLGGAAGGHGGAKDQDERRRTQRDAARTLARARDRLLQEERQEHQRTRGYGGSGASPDGDPAVDSLVERDDGSGPGSTAGGRTSERRAAGTASPSHGIHDGDGRVENTPISVVLRSTSTLRDDILRDVHSVRDELFPVNAVDDGFNGGDGDGMPAFQLLLLLSNPTLAALESDFFGTKTTSSTPFASSSSADEDTTGARAFLDMRNDGKVSATGISCHPCDGGDGSAQPMNGEDHHHDVVNRFLQDPSFLADVVDTAHETDWSVHHCRLLSHGHRGDEKISADNQLHAAAHLGAAVLLNLPAREEARGDGKVSSSRGQPAPAIPADSALVSADAFCSDHNVSEEQLALFLEVGPPAPSPPISATFRDARTPEDVDDLVEMMQALHPDEVVSTRRQRLQAAANAWMGLREESNIRRDEDDASP